MLELISVIAIVAMVVLVGHDVANHESVKAPVPQEQIR